MSNLFVSAEIEDSYVVLNVLINYINLKLIERNLKLIERNLKLIERNLKLIERNLKLIEKFDNNILLILQIVYY